MLAFFLLLFASSIHTFAQNKLQSPSEFLPHKLGEKFTQHYQLVDYFKYASNNNKANMKLVQYGVTNEERPLMIAIVSSDENMKRLEGIRTNNLKRAGLLDGSIDNAIPPITIVWLSFSVHGNEPSGSESSMEVLYHLLSDKHPETKEWLENTVVIIDPSLNPDGYSRYTHWQRGIQGKNPNPSLDAREHKEPSPTGRVNHYLFDLNRDWAWATQVETAQRLVQYNQWMPHVHPDLHEMNIEDPYYFAPAAQPFHEYITAWQRDFQKEVGKNNANYFDTKGWLYFTREVFDLLYPSYGDTYPTYNGAVGMTYEQAGNTSGGSAAMLSNGDTLTLYDRVLHHTTTALSTVEISSKNAESLVNNFEQYFSRAKQSPQGQYKSYILRGSPQRLKTLCEFLDKHQIKYGRTGRTSVSAFDYNNQKETSVSIQDQDLIVSAYQAKAVLAQVLLDPVTKVTDSLTYDITAWSLPYAYGIEAYATKSNLSITGNYDFERIENKKLDNKLAYGIICKWDGLTSVKWLSQILKYNYQVRYATASFQIDGKSYPEGTLIVTRGDNQNQKDFEQKPIELANELGVTLHLVTTGFVEKGNDFGSSKMKLIKSPKVLLLGGTNANDNDLGATWFYFDYDIDFPVTIISNEESLERVNMSAYNTLIVPDGSFNFNENQLKIIQNWIEKGGKVISISGGVGSFAGKTGFSLKPKEVTSTDSTDTNSVAFIHRYGDLERESISDYNPGAIVPIAIDATFPLGFGLSNTYFTLKTNTNYYEILSSGTNYGILENCDKSIGFIGAKAKEKMNNTLTFGQENIGSGSIIYIIDQPLFRSFWYNGKMVFSNALFF